MSEQTNENKKVENISNEGKKEENISNESKNEKNKKDKKQYDIEEPKSFAREAIEWIVCILIAFTLAVVIKYFLFTPTLVKQESMTPNILNNERVLINRLFRTFDWELKRGDIITFESPMTYEVPEGEVVAPYREVSGPVDSFLYNVLEVGKISYIKRVIGLPGEVVEIKGGEVYIDGELLEEDYLDESVKTYIPEGGFSKVKVPEGHIFAIGDNREGSSDSRLFGCVPLDKVEGRVTYRIWPLNKFGKIDK